MSRDVLTDQTCIARRRVLAAGLALPLMALAVPSRAQQAGGLRAVAVDTEPLRAHGAGDSADFLEQVLLAQMRTVFADRLTARDARAPVLTARITNLYLPSYDGAQRFDAFGGNDNIEGDGIVSSGRQVLSTTHVLTELPPSYSGSIVTAGLDQIRFQSIAYQFAYWLRREMNL